RHPQLISGISQYRSNLQTRRPGYKPNPDVRIEQEPHSRRASHSSGSVAGPMMSPWICTEPFIDASHALRSTLLAGGFTSATGLPCLVTRIGFRVLRTRSKIAKHFALNSEMAICSIGQPDHILDHGQSYGQYKTWAKPRIRNLRGQLQAFS